MTFPVLDERSDDHRCLGAGYSRWLILTVIMDPYEDGTCQRWSWTSTQPQLLARVQCRQAGYMLTEPSLGCSLVCEELMLDVATKRADEDGGRHIGRDELGC